MALTAVRAAVRVRPLSQSEKDKEAEETVHLVRGTAPPQLTIGSKDGGRPFTYDFIFGPRSSQADLFDACVVPLGEAVLEGFNATLMAYGQTGSGKTHTMGTGAQGTDAVGVGVLPRLFTWLLSQLAARAASTEGFVWRISVSFLEIYGETIRDLLNPAPEGQNLALREASEGVSVIGAQERSVKSCEDMLAVLAEGSAARATGSTLMNASSSRSHAVFTLQVEQRAPLPAPGEGEGEGGGEKVEVDSRVSKWALLDLAGSERVKRTGATGSRMQEGVNINLSLLALGNCITALGDATSRRKGMHVPYRDSKLTRLLRDSLGGNSTTLMIACVSPSGDSLEESLSTLRYADRARQIKNAPRVNRAADSSLIAQLKAEVSALRSQLGSAGAVPSNAFSSGAADLLTSLAAAAGAPPTLPALFARVQALRAQEEDAAQLRLTVESQQVELAALGQATALGGGGRPPRARLSAGALPASTPADTLGISEDEIAAALGSDWGPLSDGVELSDLLAMEQEEEELRALAESCAPGTDEGDGDSAAAAFRAAQAGYTARMSGLSRQVGEIAYGAAAKEKLVAALEAKEREMAQLVSQLREKEAENREERGRLQSLVESLQGQLAAVASARTADPKNEAAHAGAEAVLVKQLEEASRKLAASEAHRRDLDHFARIKSKTDAELGRLRAELAALNTSKLAHVNALRAEKKKWGDAAADWKKRLAEAQRAASASAAEILRLRAGSATAEATLKRRDAEVTSARAAISSMKLELTRRLGGQATARLQQASAAAKPSPEAALSVVMNKTRTVAVAAVARAVAQQRKGVAGAHRKSTPGGVSRTPSKRPADVEAADEAAAALRAQLEEAASVISARERRVVELERRLKVREDDVSNLLGLVGERDRVIEEQWQQLRGSAPRLAGSAVLADLQDELNAYFASQQSADGPGPAAGSSRPRSAAGSEAAEGSAEALRELEERIEDARAALDYNDEAILRLAGGDEAIARKAAANAMAMIDAAEGKDEEGVDAPAPASAGDAGVAAILDIKDVPSAQLATRVLFSMVVKLQQEAQAEGTARAEAEGEAGELRAALAEAQEALIRAGLEHARRMDEMRREAAAEADVILRLGSSRVLPSTAPSAVQDEEGAGVSASELLKLISVTREENRRLTARLAERDGGRSTAPRGATSRGAAAALPPAVAVPGARPRAVRQGGTRVSTGTAGGSRASAASAPSSRGSSVGSDSDREWRGLERETHGAAGREGKEEERARPASSRAHPPRHTGAPRNEEAASTQESGESGPGREWWKRRGMLVVPVEGASKGAPPPAAGPRGLTRTLSAGPGQASVAQAIHEIKITVLSGEEGAHAHRRHHAPHHAGVPPPHKRPSGGPGAEGKGGASSRPSSAGGLGVEGVRLTPPPVPRSAPAPREEEGDLGSTAGSVGLMVLAPDGSTGRSVPRPVPAPEGSHGSTPVASVDLSQPEGGWQHRRSLSAQFAEAQAAGGGEEGAALPPLRVKSTLLDIASPRK